MEHVNLVEVVEIILVVGGLELVDNLTRPPPKPLSVFSYTKD
jgi:hypothetical protein